MSYVDLRIKAGARKGKDQGRMRVLFKTATGRLREAYIIDQGSSSGVKLRVAGAYPSSSFIVDNVALATTHNARGQAGRYIATNITA